MRNEVVCAGPIARVESDVVRAAGRALDADRNDNVHIEWRRQRPEIDSWSLLDDAFRVDGYSNAKVGTGLPRGDDRIDSGRGQRGRKRQTQNPVHIRPPLGRSQLPRLRMSQPG
jgi:hypothetical protein